VMKSSTSGECLSTGFTAASIGSASAREIAPRKGGRGSAAGLDQSDGLMGSPLFRDTLCYHEIISMALKLALFKPVLFKRRIQSVSC